MDDTTLTVENLTALIEEFDTGSVGYNGPAGHPTLVFDGFIITHPRTVGEAREELTLWAHRNDEDNWYGAAAPDVDPSDRDSVIAWLAWNDPNGLYTDEDCDAEDCPRMTLQDALICYWDQGR